MQKVWRCKANEAVGHAAVTHYQSIMSETEVRYFWSNTVFPSYYDWRTMLAHY